MASAISIGLTSIRAIRTRVIRIRACPEACRQRAIAVCAFRRCDAERPQ